MKQMFYTPNEEIVVAMRAKGHTLAEVGKVLGVTGGRIGQVLQRIKSRKEHIEKHNAKALVIDAYYNDNQIATAKDWVVRFRHLVPHINEIKELTK